MTYLPGGRINATIGGNTAGAGALVSSGTLTLAGGNNVTLSQAGNAITISGGAAGGGSNTFGISNLGNTSGTSGVVSGSAVRYLFAGGNNVTLSQSVNGSSGTVTISAASQTAQTQSNIQAFYDGAASITTGTVRFSNANGINFGISGQTITASHNALTTQTVQTQNVFNMTLSGNTAGALAQISSGTLTLAGGNNITLSQAGNAITISGPSGLALANTQTTFTSGTANLVASGALTIASTTGQSFNFSVPQTSSLIGVNGVTVSSNGGTISVSGPGDTTRALDFYQNLPPGTSTLMSTIHAGLLLQPLNTDARLFPANLTANTFLVHLSGNMSTAQSSSHSMTWYVAIYSDMITGLSLLNSASTSWGVTGNSTNYELFNGPRWLSLESSQWSVPPVFSQNGDYVIGLIPRSSQYGPPISLVGANFLHSVRRSGTIGLPSVSNDSLGAGLYWNATYSNTTLAFPSIISASQVFRNANLRAFFIPHLILNNRYAGTY